MRERFQVWVVSEASGQLEQYTKTPFESRADAEQWIKRYIPNADAYVRFA